ncbi:uncharacterized protein LOC114313449 [Camellia sinensis]|uniref:uncharacterized protein LOC114313449 n=1 Tax=Camellia sinensis TaxID=4442 RepID=UPI0010359270|nr:uncharacterized protein LOC114313449 [Camellia sinensis]
MGKQLTRIEETVVHLKEHCQIQPIKQPEIQPALLKPNPTVTNFNLEPKKDNTEFMNTLIDKIKNLNLSTSGPSQVNMLSKDHITKEEPFPELTIQQIAEIQANFQDDQPSEVNRVMYDTKIDRHSYLAPSRYYYSRPTPVDILYEENFLQNHKHYQSRTIYEWNIDGLTDYQIYETLQHMMMFATVCKQNENTDHQVVRFIVSGFTGILKGWWDNILTTAQNDEILTSTRIRLDPATRAEVTEQDAVYTLVNTIIQHFIGNVTGLEDRTQELLQKLRCPSLSHFRWYKDVFMTKVHRRTYASSEHWKAKFIDGLPTLFAERVRKKLRDRHDRMSIPYYRYTYGQLIAIITDEGLALCNKLKLQQQMKQQHLTSRKEIGEFCEQFSYGDNLQYPKSSKHKKMANPKSYPKKSRKGKYAKPQAQQATPNRKQSKPYRKKSSKSIIKCYKCGQTGHYANRCKSKIQHKLNELSVDDNLKQQILQMLSDSNISSDNEDEINALYSDTSDTSEDNPEICGCKSNINQITDEVNYWKAIVEMNGLDIGGPSINVLTEDEHKIINFADHISNP